MSKFIPNRKGMEKLKQMIGRKFTNVIDRGFQVSQERASEHEDTGDLIKSGFTYCYPADTDKWVFYYGYTAPHAPYLEYGSKPHWAPPVPIYQWVRRQLGKSGKNIEDAEYLFGIAFGRIRKRLSAAEKSFAAIYKVIGVKGTAPHPFMRPSFEVMIAEFSELMRSG